MIPTEAGWYWWRETDTEAWILLEVVHNTTREFRRTGMVEEQELMVEHCGDDGMVTTALKIFGGEWGARVESPA